MEVGHQRAIVEALEAGRQAEAEALVQASATSSISRIGRTWADGRGEG